jgi:hypothetical protein
VLQYDYGIAPPPPVPADGTQATSLLQRPRKLRGGADGRGGTMTQRFQSAARKTIVVTDMLRSLVFVRVLPVRPAMTPRAGATGAGGDDGIIESPCLGKCMHSDSIPGEGGYGCGWR